MYVCVRVCITISNIAFFECIWMAIAAIFMYFSFHFFYEITFRQKPRDPIRWQLFFLKSNPSSFLYMHHDHLFCWLDCTQMLYIFFFFSKRIEITLLSLRACDFVVQSTNTQQNRPIKLHTKIMTIFGTFRAEKKNLLEISLCTCLCAVWLGSIEFPLVCAHRKLTYKISIFRALSIRGTFHNKEKIFSTLFILHIHTHTYSFILICVFCV